VIAPINQISNLAKKYNSITVVDMCQTAGLIDTDLSTPNINFAVFAGHKTLYGSLILNKISPVSNTFNLFKEIIINKQGFANILPLLIPIFIFFLVNSGNYSGNIDIGLGKYIKLI